MGEGTDGTGIPVLVLTVYRPRGRYKDPVYLLVYLLKSVIGTSFHN